jgi:hypothetical protein
MAPASGLYEPPLVLGARPGSTPLKTPDNFDEILRIISKDNHQGSTSEFQAPGNLGSFLSILRNAGRRSGPLSQFVGVGGSGASTRVGLRLIQQSVLGKGNNIFQLNETEARHVLEAIQTVRSFSTVLCLV